MTSIMPHPYREFVRKQFLKGITSFSEIGALWREHKKTLPPLPARRKYTRRKPRGAKKPCRDKSGRFSRPPNCVEPRKNLRNQDFEEVRGMARRLREKMAD